MKRNRNVLMLIILSLSMIFSGCSSLEFNIEDTIKPPADDNVTIKGTWEIEKCITIAQDGGNSKKADENLKTYIGKKVIFDNEIGAIGKNVCVNPEYKIIRTSADTFLQNKYRIDEENLALKNKEINVITITTDNQPFYEVIVTDDMTAYVYIDNGFLVLNKISDNVDEKIKQESIGNVGININSGSIKEDPLLRSGVLIGIRSSDNTYRTLWIYSKNRKIKTVSYRNQILIPRAKGFWEIGAIKDNSNLNIYAEPVGNPSLQGADKTGNKDNSLASKTGTKILFAGNDYIGIEHNTRLSVLPIDNIKDEKEVAFSDIVSKKSLDLFNKSCEAYISSLSRERANNIINEPYEKNFTLSRRNGHWIMKSRLYCKKAVNGQKYEDFDLNVMVPSKLIHYDEMNIPWNSIKSKLPWITDAYMSPNKDIAILVSNDGLNIYPIQNNSIINKQMMKIPLSESDSIIMTEWSIGRYADLWQKFISQISTDEPNSYMNYD
jgi:heat shock protein HspQ